MDHLPLPRSPVFPPGGPFEVPFVSAHRHQDGEPYDGGDFLQYPIRAGKSMMIPSVEYPRFFWLETMNLSNIQSDFEPFFQSWIFFGLLHETLSPHGFGLYDSKDYIKGRVVNTSQLNNIISEWSLLVTLLGSAERLDFATRLFDCLQLAETVFTHLWRDQFMTKHPRRTFSRTIQLSLLAICETISSLCRTTFIEDECSHIKWQRFDTLTLFNAAERADLLYQGWCPSVIANAEDIFRSVAGHFFLRHLSAPQFGGKHDMCNDEDCNLMQINPSTYKPAHVHSGCDCDHLGPQLADVAACLDAGSYPVLEVTGQSEEDLHIATIAFRSEMETPYVAFSHVWADGLGNPHALKLPRCQIFRLKDLVRGLRGRKFRHGDGPAKIEKRRPFLWIDSLLCPVVPNTPPEMALGSKEHIAFMHGPQLMRARQLKIASLAKMPDVYRNASYTVVLDQSLTAVAFRSTDPIEAAVRVLTAPWSQRLWTYQESVLSPKLIIQFADGPVDFYDLWQYIIWQSAGNPSSRALCLDLGGACIPLQAEAAYLKHPSLSEVHKIVGRRSRSVDTDEPLCTATLLGLSTGEVAAAGDGPHRMAKLWQLLSKSDDGVPGDIIFNEFSRLSLAGFTWAPAGFRQSRTRTTFLTSTTRGHAGKLSEHGLIVSHPGWRIRPGQAPWFASTLCEPAILAGLLLHVRWKGQWYSIAEPRPNGGRVLSIKTEGSILDFVSKSSHENWHVILHDDKFVDHQKSHRALLGFTRNIGPHGFRTCVFKARRLVNVSPIHPMFARILETAEEETGRLRRTWLFRFYQLCYFVYRTTELAPVVLGVAGALVLILVENPKPWAQWLSPSMFFKIVLVFVIHIAMSILGPIMQLCHARLKLAISASLRRSSIAVSNLDEVDRYFRAMGEENTAESLMEFFDLCLLQRVVHVTEAFSSDHKWCVD